MAPAHGDGHAIRLDSLDRRLWTGVGLNVLITAVD
jgi:hypothetical protein